MTPPAQSPTLSTRPSSTTPDTNLPAERTKPPVKENEKVVIDSSSAKRWVPSFSLGLGFGAQGTNANLFAINAQSGYNDYRQFQLSLAVMKDLLGDTVRLRLGPRFDFNYTQGNENTGGSNYTQGSIAAQLEVDWLRVYKAGLLGVIKGPSYINLAAGIGYGVGTGTATVLPQPFSLHEQKGVAAVIGLGLNLVNANIRRLQLGLDFIFQTNGIFGSSHSSTGNYVGFAVTARPGINKIVVEKEVCREAKGQIDEYVAKNAEFRKKNALLKEDLDQLRGFLEKGKNPITTEKIQKALVLREVRIEILKALPQVKEETVREAVRAAFVAKNEKETRAAFAKIPGLTPQILTQANAAAKAKFPDGYDFWAQITGDPVPTELPTPLPEDNCQALNQLLDQLIKEHIELNKRHQDIKGRMDTAILLDALKDHLGKNVSKFVERVHGFVLDIAQPNYHKDRHGKAGTIGHPTDEEVARLREFVARNKGSSIGPENGELKKITSHVFQLVDHELANLKDVADKMNGLKDPSASLHDKKKPNEDNTKYEWIKNIIFQIEGHTDAGGSASYNQGLSERRAEWARQLLILFGVDEKRLESIGYGFTRLAVPEKGSHAQIQTAQNKNRRVVIRVKGELPSASVNNSESTSVHIDPNKPVSDDTVPPPAGAPKAKPVVRQRALRPKSTNVKQIGQPVAPAPQPAPATAPKKGGIKFDE